MDKTKVKSLSCYVIIILNAWFSEVLSKPTGQHTIMDQINNDKHICPSAKFLTLAHFTKACAELQYKEGETELNTKTVNTFLCLEVYDAAHKLCYYGSLCQPISFNNVNEFDAVLQKFIPAINGTNAKEMFCKSLTGFEPMYKILKKPLQEISQRLSNSTTCPVICFDSITGHFNPLCTVAAWINEIDHKFKNFTIDNSKLQCTKLQKDVSSKGTKTDVKETVPQDKPPNTAIVLSSIPNDDSKLSLNNNRNSDQLDNDKTKSEPDKIVTVNITAETQKDITSPKINEHEPMKEKSDPELDTEIVDNKKQINPADTKKDKENKEDEVIEAIPNNSETIKNIQDLNPNYDNHLDDSQVSYDPNDDIPPPLETGNQNMPEAQSHYPSIKNDEDSHFFTYFTIISVMCIMGYIAYHNKQKILAILLEGRKSRGSRNRRRPSTASYRKLDCTLEEAVTSQCNVNVTHVIY